MAVSSVSRSSDSRFSASRGVVGRVRRSAIVVGAALLAVSVTAGAHAADRDSWFDQSLATQNGDGWETNMANDELYFSLNLAQKDGRCQIEIRQIKYYPSKLEYRLIHIPTSVFNVFKKGYSAVSGPMTVEYFEPKPEQYGEYHLQWWFTPGDNGPTKQPNPKVNFQGVCPASAPVSGVKPVAAPAPAPAKEPVVAPVKEPAAAPSPSQVTPAEKTTTATAVKATPSASATTSKSATPTAKDQSAETGTSHQPTSPPPLPQKPVVQAQRPALPHTGFDGAGALWLAVGSGAAGLLLMGMARPRRRPSHVRR